MDWINETAISIMAPKVIFFDNGKALTMILKLQE